MISMSSVRPATRAMRRMDCAVGGSRLARSRVDRCGPARREERRRRRAELNIAALPPMPIGSVRIEAAANAFERRRNSEA
jgi:hypothetical protein